MKKYLLFFVALTCMSNMCNPEETENYHRTVKVTNNAEYPIYVTASWVQDRTGETHPYPWWPNANKGGRWGNDDRVNPDETNITAMDTGRPSYSIEGSMTSNYMKVFFIDAAAYDRIPIGSPIPDEVILDSRVYDLEDLREIDFHIYYPLEDE